MINTANKADVVWQNYFLNFLFHMDDVIWVSQHKFFSMFRPTKIASYDNPWKFSVGVLLLETPQSFG